HLAGPASPRRVVCAPGFMHLLLSQTVSQMETPIMAISFFRGNRSKRPVGRRPSFMPRLELLEARDVPSTLTVTHNHDSGAGSLRAAIAGAHSGDTIVFDPGLNGQTIALTSDELAIRKSLDIEGPG